ncbi:caveolin-2 [Denticeps clupeoides]|uniref:Caveolin n=1 Tax=Denticeps clupeoides TaxID=299321 RepID=A0AAY4CP75_9TELE|nr:caveolin-2 [Denticeps clupeoides]
MGLETERSETSAIMDEDEFNRSIEPILAKKKGRLYTPEPDRDPHDINAHLKVDFEDVIAEPISSHSFDSIWVGSHAVFELAKYVFYLLLTTLLAVPMAFLVGIVFGVLSCIHVWVVMPAIHSCMMLLPPIQIIWASMIDMFVTPVARSCGKCLSSVHVKTTEN